MFLQIALLIVISFSLVEGQSSACFDNNIDVVSLHNCLAMYFAPANSLLLPDWNSMLPSSDEISQFKQNYYCVIVEKNMRLGKNMFNRAWGYVIIADMAWTQRNLHHSAPHPVSELYTPLMASSMFFITRSRTLLNAGASREAVSGAISPCIADDLVADAAHDNRTMFHALSAAIYEHESSCPHASCAFIQWHSFANSSCNDTKIIISTGVDNSASAYNNNDLPAIKIAKYFNQLVSVGVVAKTAKDSTCPLLALDNIQGRLFNGVAAGNVCSVNPSSNTVTGAFVNVNLEQWLEDVGRWAQTISMAFPASSGSMVLPKIWTVIFVILALQKLFTD